MKKVLSSMLVIVLLMTVSLTVFAGGSDYHNRILKRTLFCSGYCQSVNEAKSADYTEMLEYAVYLAVDQSGNKNGDQTKLNFLRENGVEKIVSQISEINPEIAFLHRSYTHRGWDFRYIDDKSNWEMRKEILRNTAERIFEFNRYYSPKEAERKREAFCKILYYQHILGDLIYDDRDTLQTSVAVGNKNKEIVETDRGLIIAFAYAHPGRDNRDIFWELDDALNVLFSGSGDAHKKAGLMPQLDALAQEARALAGMTGGINTVERLRERLAYEERLLDLLEAYLPLLLDNQPFFRNAFPIK